MKVCENRDKRVVWYRIKLWKLKKRFYCMVNKDKVKQKTETAERVFSKYCTS